MSIKLNAVIGSAVNFSMEQNHVPAVRSLTVTNDGEQAAEGLTVTISAEPAFALPFSRTVQLVGAGESLRLDGVKLVLSPEYLFSLEERLSGNLTVKAEKEGEVLAQEVYPVEVLPYDMWGGTELMPEYITAFVTPNDPMVVKIVNSAAALLEKWTGSPSFTAYQSGSSDIVQKQAAAIYGAIQLENIAYCVPPASFEPVGQRIRLTDAVINGKLGTCLDLAVLFASCLEYVGINPLLVFLEGHAFAGCWLTEENFPECVQDDPSLLTKRAADGINELCVFECTSVTAGKNVSFTEACRSAENALNGDKFQFFVDVARCRAGGIRPLPVRVRKEDGSYAYSGERENNAEATAAPAEIRLLSGRTVSGEMNKQQLWERKLLDLSLRNTLISFRVTKNAVQLIVPAVEELENRLAEGEEFRLLEKPSEVTCQPLGNKIYPAAKGEADELLAGEFENKRLRTYLTALETEKALTSVYRAAKVALEENGANTLYLAMGFLRWYESDISEKARYAPLILYPVELVRKSAAKAYTLRVRDDEPQFNVTLLEMLRVDFGLNITGLDPLPMDESGVDIRLVFSQIRQAVMGKSRWDIEELAFVGLFSFSQFIMWNDLRNRADALEKNKIVQSLIAGRTMWEQKTDFPTPDNIDDNYSPLDNAVPLSADSSQLAAICAAGHGESFVLHGPPGTGKSQTITNMIANALYQGKTVLFIAEKMAALEVVERRLGKIGLSPFCLELHSNKAKKKDVLAQLDEALNAGRIKSPEQFEAEGERLLELRRELNDTMRLIHKKQPSGFSLYDAIGQYEKYSHIEPEFGFQKPFLAKLTPELYRECEENLKQLQVTAELCGELAGHPLKEFRRISYTQSLKTELGRRLPLLAEQAEKLSTAGTVLGEKLGAELDGIEALEKACALLDLLDGENTLPEGLFMSGELEALSEKLPALCRTGRERDGLEAALTESFNGGIFDFDAEGALGRWNLAESKWALAKSMDRNKVFKSLQVLAKTPLDKEKTPEYLKTAVEYKEKQREIAGNDGLMSSLFGLVWNGGKADFDRIEKVYGTVRLVRQQLSDMGADKAAAAAVCCNYGDFAAKNGEIISVLRENLSGLSEGLAQLEADTGAWIDKHREKLSELCEKAGRWAENLELLRDWSGYRSYANALGELDTEEIPLLLEQGKLETKNILPAFYRNTAQNIAAQIMESEQTLSSFNGAIFSRVIQNYKECAEQFSLLTQHELVARLSAKIPSAGSAAAASSEIGILQKAIKSGGRMMSIRKLFDSIPNLLRRLCPCMLMSPISVAQYIDPDYPPFDMVIFDEASQMSTCEAVGAIARGENLVVVGDPKQLPPTSFFDAVHTDEEYFDKEDMESILDDCLALSMPQEHLLWHYRSRHESLIAFSNSSYYENKLFTFPSPDDTKTAVRHVQVEGVYERGKSKQNKAEAEAVVAEIVRRLRDPLLRKRSMGVVTFSSVQQNLIDDLLLETLAADPELEAIADNMYEPIFVKNLENVQGDERDVIMFSVGYGPDEKGRVALNFGPLNRDGGWRRLNVAVSRSRQEMIIFSVLRPEQIDLNRSSSDGVAGLKAFLEYASRGRIALPSREISRSGKSEALTEAVAQKLREQGWQVNTNIGCSAYKMDLGILDADGEYILGVMLDGDSYAKGGTARDRNIGQAGVLKSLGWSIHRLWAIDWWENPDKELEKICAAAERALKNKAEGVAEEEAAPAPAPIAYEKLAEQKAQLPVYEEAELPLSGDSDSFMLPQNDKKLLEQIKLVLEKEAPVEKGLLCKRLFKAWGITRRTAKLDARVDALLNQAGAMITVAGESEFVWKEGQMPFDYRAFRIPGGNGKRSADEIPPQEYGSAAAYIISNQLGLSGEDIIREVGRLFGFARITEPLKAAVSDGLIVAVRQGWLKQDGDRYEVV